MIRLLFSSAGRRVELIRCFMAAAKELGIDLETIAIDMAPEWSPACQISDFAYSVPRCTAPDYSDSVMAICQRHQVDLIIPTIDTELILYSNIRHRFLEIGTDILVSEINFVSVARDKEKTAAVLKQRGIPTPRTWNFEACLAAGPELPFPLLMKPRHGSCSAGIMAIDSLQTLYNLKQELNKNIFQELCQGKEYTINAYYGRDGRCMACIPHYRKLVRAGEVCFAETVRIPEFRIVADKLAESFQGIWGPICFQGFIDDNGKASVFEINARFGGGYPVCDRAGGTFARWILQDLTNQKPGYHDNWKEGVRMLRYDAAVFTERN